MGLFGVKEKSFASLGGAVEIALTSEWKSGSEDNALVLWRKGGTSTLRISVLTFEAAGGDADSSIPPPGMNKQAEQHSVQITPYPSGGFYIYYFEDLVEDGVPIRQFTWQVSRFVDGGTWNLAIVTFTMDTADMDLPDIRADLAKVQQEVMRLRWRT